MNEKRLPDPSYSSLCRNSMNEICLEDCVLKGEGEHFKLDPRMTLDRAPQGKTDHLKPRLQFKVEKAYRELIVNHLLGKGDIYEAVDFIQGRKVALNDYTQVFPGRPFPNSTGHPRDPESVSGEIVPTDPRDEPPEDR